MPEHLQMYCSVVDDDGKVAAAGRNLQELKDRLKGQMNSAPADFSEYQKVDIQALPILPEHVVLRSSAGPVMGFPGLRCVEPGEAPHGGGKTQAVRQWT